MATFKIDDVLRRAQNEKSRFAYLKTANTMILEAANKQKTQKTYDIFLSHSFNDKDTILGTKLLLEDYGYQVYIDWIEDPEFDRSQVNTSTAQRLRSRMNYSRSLFYATTPTSSESKWMPWECGYFDGKKNRTAILPLTYTGSQNYDGQEYLGLYPYITEDYISGTSQKKLWVRKSYSVYCLFDSWLDGNEPSQH